jgi:thymidine kinase
MGIHLILGPMFSGKTTELIRLGNQHMLVGRRVLHVRHEKDFRKNMGLVPVDIRCASRLADVLNEIYDAEVVCIDEGQFFLDLCQILRHLYYVQRSKVVYVAALNASYHQQMFQQIVILLPMVDHVQWLTSVCFVCGEAGAAFTRRRGEAICENDMTQIEV